MRGGGGGGGGPSKYVGRHRAGLDTLLAGSGGHYGACEHRN